MNKLLTALIFAAFLQNTSAQIVYSEDFGTGCSTGTLATALGWTLTNTGTNQVTANTWYISAAERGMGAGNCGDGCNGTNSRTLHVGTTYIGDVGAAYLESSAFLCAFLGLCAITDRRIESPVINCTGVSNIPFTFDYIENGEGTADDATVWYSANGGGTWTLLDNPPKTLICGSGQGLWATRNLVLPASADNNPNVRIGFRWVNNGNGVGTDPSFAVDNIIVGSPIVLGVDMIDMSVSCSTSNYRVVSWKTQNEKDSDLFAVYKSKDGVNWRSLGTVKSVNEDTGVHNYSLTDYEAASGIEYYYIEQVDFDGKTTSYKILTGENCMTSGELILYPNPSDGHELYITHSETINFIEIYSVDGKLLGRHQNMEENRPFRVQPALSSGQYFVHIYSNNTMEVTNLTVSQ